MVSSELAKEADDFFVNKFMPEYTKWTEPSAENFFISKGFNHVQFGIYWKGGSFWSKVDTSVERRLKKEKVKKYIFTNLWLPRYPMDLKSK